MFFLFFRLGFIIFTSKIEARDKKPLILPAKTSSHATFFSFIHGRCHHLKQLEVLYQGQLLQNYFHFDGQHFGIEFTNKVKLNLLTSQYEIIFSIRTLNDCANDKKKKGTTWMRFFCGSAAVVLNFKAVGGYICMPFKEVLLFLRKHGRWSSMFWIRRM